MSKPVINRVTIFFVLSLVFSLVLLMFSGSISTDAANPMLEIQEKMAAISDEEKEIIQSLFAMTLEIEEQELEEKKLVIEIEAASREINELTLEIKNIENAHLNRCDDLKEVLKHYQRNGPGSYLQIILESENLSALLRRLNLLRDLTNNTEKILKDLETSGEKLASEKTKHVEILGATEKKREQLRVTISKKLLLKEDKEKYLLTLKEERAHYQEYLTDMQQQWEELKPLFFKTSKEFRRILEVGNLPEDALSLSFTIYGIKATMDEQTLNSLTEKYTEADLPRMLFSFHTDKVMISIPEKNLVLEGSFEIKDNNTLVFKPNAGSFFGIALKSGAIEELFVEGDLILNLKPVLGNSTLKSLKLKERYLELSIILVF